MRVAVTGAAGRVGRRLVEWFCERGDDVVALDQVAVPIHEDVSSVVADLTDADGLVTATAGCDVIVHLAAAMSWDPRESGLLHRVNVDGTWNVVNAAAANRVRRLVFASSGEVYPESKAQFLPVDEHHPTEPTSVYGMTKLVGEAMVRNLGRRSDIETVVVRLPHTQEASELLDPASPFSGPRFFLHRRLEQQRELGNAGAVAALEAAGRADELTLLLARGEDGTPYRMPICDARDTAAGLGLAATVAGAADQVVYIGPDEATSMAALIPEASRLTGLPLAEVRLPGPAVNYHTSIAKARELLGFAPRWPMPTMLAEAAEARQRSSSTQA
ncbi:NAD-dependent epimerase/dehydratase family protein [Ruania zhangjianzhongii]|uniref:NAD-dependent epimerase/dehydratase family protein n=1 Tax=Ruania zhangjianzhongii TaxID=2603206 RepID=UPI0011C9B338|nr:NAD(P)-dependent oxidoreductase [Ruania zhangjianzhongii]